MNTNSVEPITLKDSTLEEVETFPYFGNTDVKAKAAFLQLKNIQQKWGRCFCAAAIAPVTTEDLIMTDKALNSLIKEFHQSDSISSQHKWEPQGSVFFWELTALMLKSVISRFYKL